MTQLLSLPSRAVAGRHVGGGSARLGLSVAVLLVAALVQVKTGNFVTGSNISSILVNVSSLLIAGIAAARLLVTGNVDLSIGGQFSLIAVLVALTARESQSLLLPVLVALAAGALLGVVNGLTVRALSISPLIVTLGLSFVYSGLAFAASDSRSVFGFSEDFTIIGRAEIATVPLPVWIALLVFGLGALALTRTVGGIRAFAIGGNAEACRRVGIKVDRSQLLNFVYMGVSMGLVALLATARLGSGTPDIGANFELEVLTAVIVGGIAFNGGSGRPLGVFLGVVLLGTIAAAMVFLGFSDFTQRIAKGLILLLALGADQYGQARRRKSTKGSGHAGAPVPVVEEDATSAVTAGATSTGADQEIALRADDLGKSYGPVHAVSGVTFALKRGEITCLVGDNGAGKSTLIKMLAGATDPTTGSVHIAGADDVVDAQSARRNGIETVWQDLAVCQNLGAVYNMNLGKEPRKLGFLGVYDTARAEQIAVEHLSSIAVRLDDLYRPLADLSGGQRQSVAISRVVDPEVKVVILDEPTAALGVAQTQNVVELIKRLAASGVAVLLVSHDVEMVSEIADHLLVMRRGELVENRTARDVTQSELIHMMAGFTPMAEKSVRH